MHRRSLDCVSKPRRHLTGSYNAQLLRDVSGLALITLWGVGSYILRDVVRKFSTSHADRDFDTWCKLQKHTPPFAF